MSDKPLEETVYKGTHLTKEQREQATAQMVKPTSTGTSDKTLRTPIGDLSVGDVVTMSKGDLSSLINDLKKGYDKKIEDMESSFEKVKLQLEKNSNVRILEKQGEFRPSGVRVHQYGPPDMRSRMDAKYKKEHPDRFHWWVTNHPTLLPLRRAQGFEPVHDKNGSEVTDLDGVLMSMPLAKAEEEILRPNRESRQRMREAVGGEFKEQAADMGVETFDDIKYDKVEEG